MLGGGDKEDPRVVVDIKSRQEERGKQLSTCQLSTPSATTPERRKSRAFIEREGSEK